MRAPQILAPAWVSLCCTVDMPRSHCSKAREYVRTTHHVACEWLCVDSFRDPYANSGDGKGATVDQLWSDPRLHGVLTVPRSA